MASDEDMYQLLEASGIRDLLSGIQLVIFDFDGVFTSNTVYVSQEGIELTRCCRSDGLGLARMHEAGVQSFVVSTEANPVVAVRCRKLGLPFKQGVTDKGAIVAETCREYGVDPLYSMYVGNDINDIPALEAVGLPVAVNDAYPEVYKHVKYVTCRSGGMGAVREVCDMIYFAKQSDRGS